MAFPIDLASIIRGGDHVGLQRYLDDHQEQLTQELFSEEDDETLLHLAAKTRSNPPENIAIIINLLIITADRIKPSGADFFLNKTEQLNNTPLHLAVGALNLPAVRMLLQHGANVFTSDISGTAPLETVTSTIDRDDATIALRIQIAELLLDNYAGIGGVLGKGLFQQINYANRVTIGLSCMGKSLEDLNVPQPYFSVKLIGYESAIQTPAAFHHNAQRSLAELSKAQNAIKQRLQYKTKYNLDLLCTVFDIFPKSADLDASSSSSTTMSRPAPLDQSPPWVSPMSFHGPTSTDGAAAAAAPAADDQTAYKKRNIFQRLLRRG